MVWFGVNLTWFQLSLANLSGEFNLNIEIETMKRTKQNYYFSWGKNENKILTGWTKGYKNNLPVVRTKIKYHTQMRTKIKYHTW